MAGSTRAAADERLAPLLAARRGDIVACLSEPLPAIAICCLLGLPREDAARIIPRVADMSVLLDGVADRDGMNRAFTATLELFAFARNHIDSVRNLPGAERSGLLAVLSDGIDSQVLTADEAQGILVQLFTAGTETTGSLIATSAETLARRVDLQEQPRSHPNQIPGAIEEILRDDGPFQFHYRWTPTDTRLHDTQIPANSRVLLMWAAANRPGPRKSGSDEQGPDEAGPAAHYAFGRGLHFCIGAHLARLEARIAIGRTSLRGVGGAEILTGTSARARNTWEQPDVVTATPFTGASVTGQSAALMLPPLSLVAATFELA